MSDARSCLFPNQPAEIWMLWNGASWVQSIDEIPGHPSYLAYASKEAAEAAVVKHREEWGVECVPVMVGGPAKEEPTP